MIDKILKATHDGTLTISNIEIPCFVLENGTRLISQRGLQKSIGMSMSGGKAGVHRIEEFLGRFVGSGIQVNDLTARTKSPILFRPPHGGRTAYGYEATILADICDAVIEARKQGQLSTKLQLGIAERCEMLMRGFAKVGIIALIDEATNYQEIRDRKALQQILDKYLLREYAKWAKRFPDEFYQEMFRLRGWQWKAMSIKRPGIIGKYTNNIVYERLAPGVLVELKQRNPKDEKGNRKAAHHQWLTPDTGVPALDRHLHSVIALMRASAGWPQFERMLARAFPKFNEQIPLALEDE